MIDREMELLSLRHELDRTIAARDLAQRMRDEAIAECERLKAVIAELKDDNAHLAEREMLTKRASEIEREARKKAAREAVEIVERIPASDFQRATYVETLREHFGLEEQGNG